MQLFSQDWPSSLWMCRRLCCSGSGLSSLERIVAAAPNQLFLSLPVKSHEISHDDDVLWVKGKSLQRHLRTEV